MMSLSFKNFFTGFFSIPNLTKLIPQILAIIIVCGFWLMLIHKGNADFSALYQKHPDDFWRALGEYFITNLAR